MNAASGLLFDRVPLGSKPWLLPQSGDQGKVPEGGRRGNLPTSAFSGIVNELAVKIVSWLWSWRRVA